MNNVFLKSDEEVLASLLADLAKQQPLLFHMQEELDGLVARNRFQLALVNQLIKNQQTKENKS